MAFELDALFFDLQALSQADYGSKMEGARPRAAETGAVPVPTVAAKVAFPDALHGFDPLPYLTPEMALAYHNPQMLVRDSGKRSNVCLACHQMQYPYKCVMSSKLWGIGGIR